MNAWEKGKYLMILMATLFMLTFMATSARSAVPMTMNYQGYLTDSEGTPVNGTVDMTFSLYATTAGSADTAATAVDADTVDGQHASEFAGASHNHDSRYHTHAQVKSMVADLQSQIDDLKALLNGVSRSDNDITFSGVNVHVVNGTGTTDGTVNGLGNLIVGYNETRGSGDDRSGSHNIVVGSEHNYSSYGGLVAG